MRTIAVYSPKGGVGKTSLAVNLAWCSAALSSRRTLLWDLDGQSAATFLAGGQERPAASEARALFARELAPARLIVATAVDRLDLLPADPSLHRLDPLFEAIGKRKRLARLLDGLESDYDRVLLDCPPGLAATAEQVLRAADLILVPLVPSPLSRRALEGIVAHLDRSGRTGALLPLFNMVDRRRSMHREALGRHPDWPAIPMASAVEAMARRRAALGDFAPRSPAAAAIAALWEAIERKLARSAESG